MRRIVVFAALAFAFETLFIQIHLATEDHHDTPVHDDDSSDRHSAMDHQRDVARAPEIPSCRPEGIAPADSTDLPEPEIISRATAEPATPPPRCREPSPVESRAPPVA